jgi:hypothetical protein
VADAYTFIADATVAPISGGFSSGIAALDVPLNEALTLSVKSSQVVELISDAAATVQLPGPTSTNPSAPLANVVVIKVVGPRVKAAITTADGASQIVPVDPLFVLHTTTVSPITALTLTRTPGNDTFVHLFLGQI